MQQWLDLLIKFATPVFKTLVYAGTSNLLTTIEEQLKEKQKEQVINLLASRATSRSKKRQKELEELVEIGYQKASEIQEEIATITTAIAPQELDFQQQRFQAEKVLQQQLLAQKRESLLQLAAYQRETALLLPEVQKTLENWPLKLLPSQLLAPENTGQPLPLKVLLAPPQIPLPHLQQGGLDRTGIEGGLTQQLREFLSENYSWHSQERPVEFLGGIWDSKHFHGEASIKVLFATLKSQPTLILESEVEGESLIFRLAYWGLGQEKYCYETIFKLPYREFLQESARNRAGQWRQTRDQLLALGKDPETVRRLGGDNAANLAILEEIEELQALGIEEEGLAFSYQIGTEDLESLCQFLATCHCLVAGWLADVHYLIHEDVPPLLPGLLCQLVPENGEESLLSTVMGTTVAIYQEVVKALARERPYWLPELALKLARSLTQLPDSSLAREQVNYSLALWLQQRHLSPLKGLKSLSEDFSTLTDQDRDYLTLLQTCLSALGDEEGVAQVQEILGGIADNPALVKPFAPSHTLTEVDGPISALGISSQGERLVSCDRRGLQLWELSPVKGMARDQLNSLRYSAAEGAFTFTLSPDGQTLASCDRARDRSHLKIWHLPTGKLRQTLFGHKKQIRALAISGDGQILASGSHKIKLWKLATGEPCQSLFGHKQWVNALAMGADGKTLVSGSDDKTVRLWNWQSGELVRTLSGHQASVRAMAVSPDGNVLVSGGEDCQILVWDLTTGKRLQALKVHSGAIHALAISPDGEYLFSGSGDKTIAVWHLGSLRLLQTLTAHSAAVGSLAFCGDSRLLVSGSEDRTIKIWEARGVM